MRWFHVSLLTASLLTAACASQTEQEAVLPPATPLPSPDIISAPSSPLSERVATETYEISVNVPAELLEFPVFSEVLSGYVREVKRVNNLPEVTANLDDAATASLPWTLTVTVSQQAKTGRLLSALSQEYVYTGGAHGNGAFVSFLYDVQETRLLNVSDLFSRDVTADMRAYVKQELEKGLGESFDRQMLDEGMAAAKALDVFTLVPATDGASMGLVFHYAPYEVAPYAMGTQSITVPTSVFAANLKPEYRAEFR